MANKSFEYKIYCWGRKITSKLYSQKYKMIAKPNLKSNTKLFAIILGNLSQKKN